MNVKDLFNIREKKRIFKKFISIIVSFIFLFFSIYVPDTALAKVTNTPALDASHTLLSPKDVQKIKIPKDNGRVKQRYKGTNGKLIIHIQDAHVNYEGQRNLSKILKNLIEKYGINLVLVEGGSGDISLSLLRHFATKKIREKIADKYLRKGKIAGEEYLDIVSEPVLKFHLHGIENRNLYKSNVEQFLKIDRFRNEASDFVNSLHRALKILKERLYSEELKEFERKNLAYEKEEIDIISYCKYLKGKIDSTGYNQINSLLKVNRLEDSIDFEKVNTERDAYITILSKRLPKDKLNILLKMSVEFKSGSMSPKDYYIYIRELGSEAKIDIKDYPNLHIYTYYIKLFEDIDRDKLFKELSSLEDRVRERLCRNDIQRDLGKTTENLSLIKNFVNLRLSPDELKEYQSHKKDFNLKKYSKFTNNLAKKYNLPQAFVYYNRIIDKNFKKLEEFYKIAKKRDKAFLKNAVKIMEEKNQKQAILIAGGFHTEHLMPLFRDENYSYIVVTPKVVHQTDLALYRCLLKGELSAKEKAVQPSFGLLRIKAVRHRYDVLGELTEQIIGSRGVIEAADILVDLKKSLPRAPPGLKADLDKFQLELDETDSKNPKVIATKITTKSEAPQLYEFLIKEGRWQRLFPSELPAGEYRWTGDKIEELRKDTRGILEPSGKTYAWDPEHGWGREAGGLQVEFNKLNISHYPQFGASLKERYNLRLTDVECCQIAGPTAFEDPFGDPWVRAALEITISQALSGSINGLAPFLPEEIIKPFKKEMDGNAVTVGLRALEDLAKRLDVIIIVLGNEGKTRDKAPAIPVGKIINPDGKRGVILFLNDSIEGTNYGVWGRPGAWSIAALVPEWNAFSTDGYRAGISFCGPKLTAPLDPVIRKDNTVEIILTKIAWGKGYTEDDMDEFYKKHIVYLLNRSRHREIMDQLEELEPRGLEYEIFPDGDFVPRVMAAAGFKVRGKDPIVIGVGGANEGIMAHIAASLLHNGGSSSRYVNTKDLKKKTTFNLNAADDFPKEETDEFAELDSLTNKLRTLYGVEIAEIGDPAEIMDETSVNANKRIGGVVAGSAITGARELLGDIAENLGGVTYIPRRYGPGGDIVVKSFFITKAGEMFLAKTAFHTHNLNLSRFKIRAENKFQMSPKLQPVRELKKALNRLQKDLNDLQSRQKVHRRKHYRKIYLRLKRIKKDLEATGSFEQDDIDYLSTLYKNIYAAIPMGKAHKIESRIQNVINYINLDLLYRLECALGKPEIYAEVVKAEEKRGEWLPKFLKKKPFPSGFGFSPYRHRWVDGREEEIEEIDITPDGVINPTGKVWAKTKKGKWGIKAGGLPVEPGKPAERIESEPTIVLRGDDEKRIDLDLRECLQQLRSIRDEVDIRVARGEIDKKTLSKKAVNYISITMGIISNLNLSREDIEFIEGKAYESVLSPGDVHTLATNLETWRWNIANLSFKSMETYIDAIRIIEENPILRVGEANKAGRLRSRLEEALKELARNLMPIVNFINENIWLVEKNEKPEDEDREGPVGREGLGHAERIEFPNMKFKEALAEKEIGDIKEAVKLFKEAKKEYKALIQAGVDIDDARENIRRIDGHLTELKKLKKSWSNEIRYVDLKECLQKLEGIKDRIIIRETTEETYGRALLLKAIEYIDFLNRINKSLEDFSEEEINFIETKVKEIALFEQKEREAIKRLENLKWKENIENPSLMLIMDYSNAAKLITRRPLTFIEGALNDNIIDVAKELHSRLNKIAEELKQNLTSIVIFISKNIDLTFNESLDTQQQELEEQELKTLKSTLLENLIPTYVLNGLMTILRKSKLISEEKKSYIEKRGRDEKLIENLCNKIAEEYERMHALLLQTMPEKDIINKFSQQTKRYVDVQVAAAELLGDLPAPEYETIDHYLPTRLYDLNTTLWQEVEKYLNYRCGRFGAYKIVPVNLDALDGSSPERLASDILNKLNLSEKATDVLYLPTEIISKLGPEEVIRISEKATLVSYEDAIEGKAIFAEGLLAFGEALRNIKSEEDVDKYKNLINNLYKAITDENYYEDFDIENLDLILYNPYKFLMSVVVYFPKITPKLQEWLEEYQKNRIIEAIAELAV